MLDNDKPLCLCDNIMVQRDINVPAELSVKQALSEVSDWDPASDDVIAVLAYGNDIHELNLVGALLFEAAKKGMTLSQAAEELVEVFDIDQQQALADSEQFFGDLIEKKLLKI